MHRIPSTLLAIGLLMIAAPAQAEKLIVFKATGVALTSGQAIDGDQPLRLATGQSVELIAENGRVVKLAGPHEQPPSPGKPAQEETVTASLKAMVTSGGVNTTHMGVTRGVGQAIPSGKDWLPDPWLIDVTKTGTHCQRAGQPMILWRPSVDQEINVRLATAGNTWKASARWPAGAEKLAPPPTMPIKDGSHLQVSLDKSQADLTLRVIPEQVTAPPVLAAWLHESGCRAQSLALLRTLH
ncbi:MAG: hypothetical protein HQM03_03485 [Magnetococcales bacterium]|nr:hypothetical protein [Magnetococcales bacterium]